MKAELQKFLKLFEELEEAGETASLTLVTKGGSLNLHHPCPPLQLQLRLNPCHQLLVSVAAIVAPRQGPAATSGQLPTRPLWQRQPPVLHRILPVLSGSTPLRHLAPGGAGWRLSRGTSHPSTTSMWTALPHQHHRHLQHQHHHHLLYVHHLHHRHHRHHRHHHLHCLHLHHHPIITWIGSKLGFGPGRRRSADLLHSHRLLHLHHRHHRHHHLQRLHLHHHATTTSHRSQLRFEPGRRRSAELDETWGSGAIGAMIDM